MAAEVTTFTVAPFARFRITAGIAPLSYAVEPKTCSVYLVLTPLTNICTSTAANVSEVMRCNEKP